MIELHGWMTIFSTYKDEDLNFEIQEDKIIQKVKNYIQTLKNKNIDGLKVRCGTYYLNVNYYSNHRNDEVDAIFIALKKIAEIATGSYGVVYYMDDEDMVNYNYFMTMVIKRGKVEWKKDLLLSPFMPSVHDEY